MVESNVSNESMLSRLRDKIRLHLDVIYPDADPDLADQLIAAMNYPADIAEPDPHQNRWTERDTLVIAYGNSIYREGEVPLQTLHRFLDVHLREIVNSVHILPFFPFSSDDGFSVINYKQVNESLGEWRDIERIGADYRLMSDLVINHCSSRSQWFEQFRHNEAPGKDYFIEVPPDTDLSDVVRPRTSPLLREVDTLDGTRHVWCTFSHDQVDLNFQNPALLLEMIDIIGFYLERGVRLFRLDAIAFLWKRVGSNCLNLTETHELVRLLRTLLEHRDPEVLIITETNIPNRENLAYFGNANEAHLIYNFALPPLLLHAMVTGNNHYLNNWLMSMPPAQDGTTYLNFIASHDGIGLRPVEGILSEPESAELMTLMEQSGGHISWRNLSDSDVRPYEINISLFDALSRTVNGEDNYQIRRFLCAHTIMAALEGIPAFYIHSLLATENDHEKVKLSGSNRAINRHVWAAADIEARLANQESQASQVLSGLRNIMSIRRQQPAFHPNATQYTLHLGEGLFAFWRQSRRREQSIFCIHNITHNTILFPLSGLNLVETQEWQDLFTEVKYQDFRETVEIEPYQCLWLSNLG